MDKYQEYRKALSRVQNNWIQGSWSDHRGGVCMIGSFGSNGDYLLESSILRDLDRELSHSFSYRMIKASSGPVCFILRRGHLSELEVIQGAVQLWNDIPWRKKESVVNILQTLTDKSAGEYYKEKNQRLLVEIDDLKARIVHLEKEIARLSEENGILKRLTNKATLAADRRSLQQLSDELNERWKEVSAIPSEFANV